MDIKVSGRPTDRVSAVLLSSFVADFPEGFTREEFRILLDDDISDDFVEK